MKIMLIEDDTTMRSLLQTLLEMEGFDITPFTGNINKEEILRELKKNQPDTLIMDVHLQNLNGISLLTEIRESETAGRVKIIMTSGMDLKIECQEAGADGFLQKPYIPDDLLKFLRLEEE
ncbi:MAG: response regulator [Anaerolineaceae bacterium]|nr:response regulator [Anaerolineaceae bacterium]